MDEVTVRWLLVTNSNGRANNMLWTRKTELSIKDCGKQFCF